MYTNILTTIYFIARVFIITYIIIFWIRSLYIFVIKLLLKSYEQISII